MSEANGAAGNTSTVTQTDLERERAHTQHFKQMADEAIAKAKRFEGIDPDDYKKTKAELDEIKKKAALGDPVKLEEWQKSKEQELRSSIQKEADALREKAEKLERQNKELTVTDRVFAEAAPNIMGDMADFIKQQIRNHGDLNEKGEIVFKDGGKEMYAPGSTTALMTTAQFVEHLRSKYPSSFKASDKGGTKTAGEKQGAYTGKELTRDQISALPDKGKEYFRQNPAAAQRFLQGK